MNKKRKPVDKVLWMVCPADMIRAVREDGTASAYDYVGVRLFTSRARARRDAGRSGAWVVRRVTVGR